MSCYYHSCLINYEQLKDQIVDKNSVELKECLVNARVTTYNRIFILDFSSSKEEFLIFSQNPQSDK